MGVVVVEVQVMIAMIVMRLGVPSSNLGAPTSLSRERGRQSWRPLYFKAEYWSRDGALFGRPDIITALSRLRWYCGLFGAASNHFG
jgi:hypothetical protein